MFFLDRSCVITYSDFTVKRIENCDSLSAIFDFYDINIFILIISIVCIILTIHFLIKIYFLFSNKENQKVEYIIENIPMGKK